MAMFAPAVPTMTSQHPRIAAFPAKQNPDTIPTSGTSPLSRANE